MSLKEKIINSTKWTTVATILISLFAIFRLSILSRLLPKEDFGIMAIVMLIYGFVNLFTDLGLTPAMLHKQNISKDEFNSLFWINLLFSFILFFLILLSTPFIVDFYQVSELGILIPLICLNLIISSIGKQYKVFFQKELNFKKISLIDILGALSSLFTATVLAYLNFGVYSLVFSILIQFFIVNIIYFILGQSENKLKLHFKTNEVLPFLKIGVFQTGSEILNYFNRDFDILIIGKILGPDLLGSYSLIKQLIRRPLQIIDPIVTKIGVSLLPKFQDNEERLVSLVKTIFEKLHIVNLFVYSITIIFSEELITIFYGNDYVDMSLELRIFAVIVYLRSISGQISLLVITKGKTDISLYWNIFTSFSIPLSIFIGVNYFNLVGAIVSQLIIQLLLIVPLWYIFYKKMINYSFSSYFKPLILAVFIQLALLLINLTIDDITIEFKTIELVMFIFLYFVYIYLIDKKVFKLKI